MNEDFIEENSLEPQPTPAFEEPQAVPSPLPAGRVREGASPQLEADFSDEELTQLAVQHIQALGGNVSMPSQESPHPLGSVQEPVVSQQDFTQPTLQPSGQMGAQEFDQLARKVAVTVSSEAGAGDAANDVYQFVKKLGPDAVSAYQSNEIFRDMVDTKINTIVGSHSRALEDQDRLPLPASEEVGGSTEKELRAGLNGHRQAFENAGLGQHMSFDDFVRDLEL